MLRLKFLILILFFLPGVVLATGFSLTPGKIEVELVAGASLTKTITITNDGSEVDSYKVIITDLPEVKDGMESAASFITVSENNFVLGPKTKKTLLVTIKAPLKAVSQSYHSAIFIETTGQTGIATGLVRLGSLVFVRVAGERKEVGELTSFKILTGWFAKVGNIIPVALVFNNTGNTYLNPYGLITVSTISGKQLGYVKIDPWYVLPGQTKIHDVRLKNPGTGIYQLKLQLNRGYNNVIDQQNRYLIIWSWPILILALVIVLIIMWFGLRWWFKRKMKYTL